MKFVNPTATLITEKDPYKKIELAGRTCYKSEDKITDESAPKFVRALIKSQHTAMLEHQTFVFELKCPYHDVMEKYLDIMYNHPYIHTTDYEWPQFEERRVLVSGNVRALNECEDAWPMLKALQKEYPALVYSSDSLYLNRVNDGAWHDITASIVDLDTLPNLTMTEVHVHKTLTFRVVTDRGVTHEMVRHRPASYAQESTRYVSYQNGISIALPTGYMEKAMEVQEEYETAFFDAESHYRALLDLGEKPQQARAVLPTGLKTEIVMTTNLAEWQHFFNLRLWGTTGAPHPDMKTVAGLMYDEALNKDPVFAKWASMTSSGEVKGELR